jgi:hypothetical protein
MHDKMKVGAAPALVLAAVAGLAGCVPDADGRQAGAPDLTPPAVLGSAATAPGSVEIGFSEPVTLVVGSFVCSPPLPLAAWHSQGDALVLEVGPQVPGARYLLELSVEDAHGNGATIIAPVYGYNAEVPAILLNELTVRGSPTHPDIVELRIGSRGNMGGLVLYDGTPGNWTSRLVFPPLPVEAGDFVLAHFKPEGIAAEVDETSDRAASGGLDASTAAWDFWLAGATGLNGNNGVLGLYARIGGSVLDAILYSNRTSASDTTYGGFGTADTQARAVEIVQAAGWRAGAGGVRPEDAVSPEASTSTRSLCRRRGVDTDAAGDWYVVPTRGATFGAENLEEEYVP